jgi:hypothetical protein
MANASIRGHLTQIKIYMNSGDTKIANLKSFEANQKSTFIQSEYVGVAIPEGDQSMEGWDGSFMCEVKDPFIDDFIDALITNNLAGIGVADYSLTDTENYTDGTVRSYVYSDMQFKLKKKVGGLKEKTTKGLDFQAGSRNKLGS